MQFLAWAFTGLLALVFMLFWMGAERRVPVTTLPSAFLWLYWGWNAGSVEHGTQEVVTQSYPALRWFGIFLALVNAMLLVMYLWTDEDEDVFAQF